MRKFLSLLLTVTMLVTVFAFNCISVSADATVLTSWDGTRPESELTSGNISSTSGTVSRNIALSSKGTGSVISAQIDEAQGKSIKVNHTYLMGNYRLQLEKYLDTAPVSSIEYKMYIPKKDDGDNAAEDENAERSVTVTYGYGTNGTTGFGSTLGGVNIKFSNGSVTAKDGTTSGTSISYAAEGVNYKAGEWNTIQIKAYSVLNKGIVYGAYVNDTMVLYGVGSNAISEDKYSAGYGINQIMLTQASSDITTYLDDITVSVMPASEAPADPTGGNSSMKTEITNVSFDNDSDDAATYSTGSGVISNRKLQQGGDTGRTTTYNREVIDGTNKALVINTSNNVIAGKPIAGTLMVHNARVNLAEYMSTTEENVLEISYDMYIPSGTESAARVHKWNFSGNSDNLVTAQFEICSMVVGGKLVFDEYLRDTGIDVIADEVLTERFEAVDFASDTWNTVKYLIKLNYNSETSAYDIKVYGVFDGKCVYEKDVTLPSADGGFVICQQRVEAYADDSLDTTVTKYDNVKIAHYTGYTDKTQYNVWSSSNYVYPVSLVLDADSNIVAKGRFTGDYTQALMIVSVYDENKKLISVSTSDTLDADKYITASIAGASYLNKGYSAKAMLLNNIENIVPYTNNASLSLGDLPAATE